MLCHMPRLKAPCLLCLDSVTCSKQQPSWDPRVSNTAQLAADLAF